jgi:hypothetical protein
MTNRNLLEEAIADAKAVKEAAIANAKAALEESFAPYITEKFKARVAELEENEDLEEEKEMAKEGYGEEAPMEEEMETTYEADVEESEVDEMNLEELLAELDEELSEMDDKQGMEETINEAEEEEVEVEDEEEINLEDMSEDELKSLIEDVIEDMVKAGELEPGENFEAEDEMEMDMDIKMDDDTMDMDMEMDDKMMSEAKKKRKPYGGNEGDIKDKFRGKIKKDTAEEEDKAAYEKKRMREELEKTKAELEETLSALAEVRVNLQEVNLLNAKLLYTNKIFRAKNLNENQKVQVLGAFDKAATVKEVKLVFETLNNEIKTSRKSPVTESMKRGLASKSAGVAPKKEVILEADTQVLRWQKLAGIIKS